MIELLIFGSGVFIGATLLFFHIIRNYLLIPMQTGVVYSEDDWY